MGALALLAALWPVVVGGARDRRGLVPGRGGLGDRRRRPRSCSPAPARARRSRRSTGRTGTSSAQSRAGARSRSSGAPTTAGIDFPAGKTTVLGSRRRDAHCTGGRRRSTRFAGDRWVEALYATGVRRQRRDAAARPAPPARPRRRAGWVKQEVDVRALVDDHVIAAGQPMEIAGGRRQRIRYLERRRHAARRRSLRQMRRYTVWSYAPDPTPAALVRSPPTYPAALARYLDVGRTVVPPFGVSGPGGARRRDLPRRPLPGALGLRAAVARGPPPHREGAVAVRGDDPRSSAGCARTAASATTSIRRTPAGVPPLVDFLERTKLGYCQQFAGTMALMLRYLGIPARVAVGFTSGTWKDGTLDRDRSRRARLGGGLVRRLRLAHLRSDAGPRHAVGDVHERLRLGRRDPGARHRPVPRRRAAARRDGPPRRGARRRQPPAGASTGGRRRPARAARRRAPRPRARQERAAATAARRRRDPRAPASAARAELVAFMRDQGVAASPATASIGELVAELRRLGVGSDAFAAAFSRARYGPPAGAPRQPRTRRGRSCGG